jgi:hypothetical protein
MSDGMLTMVQAMNTPLKNIPGAAAKPRNASHAGLGNSTGP